MKARQATKRGHVHDFLREVVVGFAVAAVTFASIPFTATTATTVAMASEYPAISGYKWNDINGNGIREAGELGLQTWTIKLWRDGTQVGSAVTDNYGRYEFVIDPALGRLPGTYSMTEVLKTGWKQTAAPAPVVIPENAGAQAYAGNNFGNFLLGSISGFEWIDVDGDGIRDADEPRGANRTIELLKDGAVVKSTKTGPTGWYSFIGLEVGTYMVREVEDAAHYRTRPADPGVYTCPIKSGSVYCESDFGNAPYSSIKPLKVHDLDMDMQRDPLEPLLSGWTMHLGDSVRNELRDPVVTTDAIPTSPAWARLRKGDYRVWEDLQPGWTPVGSAEQAVALVPGQDVVISFYNVISVATIEGLKFHDHDRDGVQDEGDEALPGWTMTLSSPDGSPVSATTDNEGRYSFADVRPEVEYTLTEEDRGWWRHTTPASVKVTPLAGQTIGVDFGNVLVGDLAGRKYHDLDGNGSLDQGEPPVADLEVTLFGSDGLQVGLPARTDANGQYEFVGLTPGVYKVAETLAGDWVSTNGSTKTATVEGGAVTEAPAFLNTKLASAGGIKFDDGNMSGGRDDGENAVPGFTMALERCVDGVWSGVGTAVTGPDGTYRFDGLMPGKYRVRETQQAGWTATLTPPEFWLQGGDERLDLDLGNVRLSSLTLCKWDDANSNGAWDQGESPLADWGFRVTGSALSGDPLDRWVTTGADGKVSIDGLLPGTYEAEEQRIGLALDSDGTVLEPGWRPTTPPSVSLSLAEGANETTSFGNIHLGWVWGRVTHEVYGYPIPGIEIVLEETGETTRTNANGYYFLYTVEPNETSACPTPDYLVGMDLAGTSWRTHDAVDKSVVVAEGQGARADFTVYSKSYGYCPRTIGFWKNWRNHYTYSEIEALVALVRAGSTELADLKAADISSLLTLSCKSSMRYKARAQYIASWLNVASGKVGLDAAIDVSRVDGWQTVVASADADGATTAWGLIQDIERWFGVGDLSRRTWEAIKNVLDAFNNGLLGSA